jgi:hypothetical protein
MNKAVRWLNKRCKTILPLTKIAPAGYAYFSAYLFKLKRENKCSVWYLATLDEEQNVTSVKRICTY